MKFINNKMRGPIMAELLFYNEPVFLNREVHKELRFSSSDDYSYTENVNSVPLTGIEFFEASRDMPVVFGCDEKNNYFPLALLSLMESGHKHINEKGEWVDSYIPAFVRRYPFVLTDEGTVCFDKKAGRFNEEKGDALFNEEGENSEVLNNIINFLNNYDQQYKLTQKYCEALKKAELLKPFNLQILVEQDRPLRMEGLYVVDEQKLMEIEESELVSWFRSGWLAWTYAHLHSLGALERLAKRQKPSARKL